MPVACDYLIRTASNAERGRSPVRVFLISQVKRSKGMANTKRVYKTLLGRFFGKLRNRFDLRDDSATQEEVVETISKGTEFRGTNLWVLICATFIASLGLNVNSTAVIIGAMLISPLMGPIMGLGLSLGINDFTLMKKSLRNFSWMVVVSVLTSTFFFFIIPSGSAQSELLARTSPTTYDVLIAFVGGVAGMLAQTRKDRTSTVISGVAIATALMPPLCTMGFGIATMQWRFILGASYLFLINTVFIAISAYLMVVFLKYEKKVTLDKSYNKRMSRWVWFFVVLIIVPSIFLTVNILRTTTFETNADRYVASVFQFNNTMIVDYDAKYRYEGNKSVLEIKLVGDPLSQDVINNASAQLTAYGLMNTELIVKQPNELERWDISTIQKSYAEILDEKNATIGELNKRLSSLQAIDTLSVSDLSKELGFVAGNVRKASMARHVSYDTDGHPRDTTIICIVTPDNQYDDVDTGRITSWLAARMKNNNIQVLVER